MPSFRTHFALSAFGPSRRLFALITGLVALPIAGCGEAGDPEEMNGSGGLGNGVATGGALGSGGNGMGTGGLGSGGAPLGTGGLGSGGAPLGTGGLGSGGAGTGGSPGTGGDGSGGEPGGGDETCPLPSSFEWTSTGPLAEPKSPAGANWVSMKDFTVTRQDDEYLVYATVWNEVPMGQPNREWQGVFLKFGDFDAMDDAPQTSKPGMVAPHLFYFTPKDLWVLGYQWGFKYATSKTPDNPGSWSPTTNLLSNNPTQGDPDGTGPIDLSLICDDDDCYIFFAGDNGVIYRGSMPVANFPGTFTNSAAILRDNKTALFEGVEVYKVKGEDKYLMIVEAAGDSRPIGDSSEWGARFFRAFTATSLGGDWTEMPNAGSRANPFAGSNNVTFPGGQWTSDISHGDIVRDDPSEKKEIDVCNLRLLYQGHTPGGGSGYGTLPYRPGLLTLVQD